MAFCQEASFSKSRSNSLQSFERESELEWEMKKTKFTFRVRGYFRPPYCCAWSLRTQSLCLPPPSKAGVYDYAGTPDRVWDSSHPIVEHRIEELKRRGMLDKYKGDQQRA